MMLAIDQLKDELRKLTPEELKQFTSSELAQIEWALKDARCAERVASFEEGPLYWLTKLTKTENPQHREQTEDAKKQCPLCSKGLPCTQNHEVPYNAPFPRKDYLVHVFASFLARHKQLYIAKSRTMLTTWSAAGYASWAAQFHHEETLVQTLSQEKAEHVIDYCCQLWDYQEPWLKERHPLERRSLLTIAWKGGGEVAAIPSGADKVRSFHSTTYILDEAAHVPEGEECMNAVIPSGARIIAISTARAGWFGDSVQR